MTYTVGVNLDHLAKSMFVLFLHCKPTPFPLSFILLEASHYV
jgi:hypothetical protein